MLIPLALLFVIGCGEGVASTPSPQPALSPSVIRSPSPSQSPSVVPSPSVLPTSRCQYRYENGLTLPDLNCTPGEADPTITQANIQSTICATGWLNANRPRPPVAVTNNLKYQGLMDYGKAANLSAARAIAGQYEEDHDEAREIGGLSAVHIGSNNMPTNLWPEPAPAPNQKDSVENAAHSAVCAVPPKISLADAQRIMAQDWPALGRQLGVPGL